MPVLRLARAFLSAAILVAAASASAIAEERTFIEGEPVQGGLIVGQTDPGAEVRLGENRIPVGSEGLFAFGFRRDAPPQISLKIDFSDGGVELFDLKVRQREFDVQRIEGVAQSFVEPPEETLNRIAREREMVSAARTGFRDISHFVDGFVWPVRGPITGVFGSQRIFNGQPRAPHSGVDIAAAEGTPVRAPATGIVILRGDLYFSGNTLIIDHGHGVNSTYLHMSEVFVVDGQEVAQGDIIGAVGATGRVTGPHLHWGVNWFGVRLDPELLVAP